MDPTLTESLHKRTVDAVRAWKSNEIVSELKRSRTPSRDESAYKRVRFNFDGPRSEIVGNDLVVDVDDDVLEIVADVREDVLDVLELAPELFELVDQLSARDAVLDGLLGLGLLGGHG